MQEKSWNTAFLILATWPDQLRQIIVMIIFLSEPGWHFGVYWLMTNVIDMEFSLMQDEIFYTVTAHWSKCSKSMPVIVVQSGLKANLTSLVTQPCHKVTNGKTFFVALALELVDWTTTVMPIAHIKTILLHVFILSKTLVINVPIGIKLTGHYALPHITSGYCTMTLSLSEL